MRIIADPIDALYDQPVRVRIEGCRPGATVAVRARADDDLNRRWASHATFIADEAGRIDLARQAAASGTYPGRDSMGLFWSMELDRSVVERSGFIKLRPTPVEVTLAAEVAGEVVEEKLTRRFMAGDLRRTEVRDGGLIATFVD